MQLFINNLACTSVTYDVIVLSESWLDQSVNDSELSLDNYVVFRCDRNKFECKKSAGGGVICAVKKNLVSSVVVSEATVFEQLFVKIKMRSESLLLGVCYFPPGSPCTSYSHYVDTVNGLVMESSYEKFLFIGDFNLSGYDWIENDGQILLQDFNPNINVRSSADVVCSHANSLQLKQFNCNKNLCGNVLDLVFSNNDHVLVSLCVDPLIPRDIYHDALVISFPESPTYKLRSEFNHFNFYKGNYVDVCKTIDSVNWALIFKNNSDTIDNLLDALMNELYSIISVSFPLKTRRVSTFPKWFSYDLKNAIFLKKRLHRYYAQSRNDFDYAMFKNQRAIVKRLRDADFSKYIAETERNVKDDPKSFFKFVNNTCNNGIPNVMSLDTDIADSGYDIANLFAKHFSSVYNDVTLAPFNESFSNDVLSSIRVSLTEVLCALDDIDVETSPGPDGLHPYFVKSCKDVIAKPLCFLFNESLQRGSFPALWRQSFVIPVHKSGDKSNVKNYRPISVLNIFAKVLDSLVYKKVSKFIFPLIIDEQHGFVPKKSTVTNLATIVDYIVNNFVNDFPTHVIYTDITKAFDTVNICRLVSKLRAFGINGSLLGWFASYLSNRVQRVKVLNFISYEIFVTSGVAQGSHLGALLFIIYINDIRNAILFCRFLLFADDFKLFRVVKSFLDVLLIEADIVNVTFWFESNGLFFNIPKCGSMIFSRKQTDLHEYYINGLPLANLTVVKDLGVWFDPKLNFSFHIDYVASNACRKLFMVRRRAAPFRDVRSLVVLYNFLVKPILLYASPIWVPSTAASILKIERVQHMFLRFASFKTNSPMRYFDHNYENIGRSLNVCRIECYWAYADLMFFFKLCNNFLNAPSLVSQVNIHVPARSLRHLERIFVIPHQLGGLLTRSVINRLADLVNSHSGWIEVFGLPISAYKALLRKNLFADF